MPLPQHGGMPAPAAGAANTRHRGRGCARRRTRSPRHRGLAGWSNELLADSSCIMSMTLAESRSPISATAPAQNTLPTTAASASSDFASDVSVSRRAAMMALIDSGTATPPRRETPRRPSRPADRGPAGAGRTPRRTADCPRPARGSPSQLGWDALAPSRPDTSCPVSCSDSGARLIRLTFLQARPELRDAVRRTPAGPSQRAAAAPPSARSARCSRNASIASSAQCRSSNTSTVGGPPLRRARGIVRHAVNSSSRSAPSPASMPSSGSSRWRNHARSSRREAPPRASRSRRRAGPTRGSRRAP